MNAVQKFQVGFQILLQDGFVVFFKTLRRYVVSVCGQFRPNESEIAFEALGSDNFKGLMIDVGAHHGGALSSFARSGSQVFAFEPDSKNREQLIISYGDFQNVFIDARAVSNHSQKKALLYRSEQSTGISGLSPFHSSHKIAGEVEVTTLEDFFSEHNIKCEKDIFLKIDTEGFDLHVLQGFPWIKCFPILILCEFENSKSIPLGYTFYDLCDFLISHGYKIILSEWHPIKKYGCNHKWKKFAIYPCELDNANSWGNIFAVKDTKIYNAILHICNLK